MHICRYGVIALTLCLATAIGTAQTTRYVDDDAADDPGPNDSSISDPLEDGTLAHPYDAIQEAIGASVNGDEIIVQPGTYIENINLLGKAITLRSSDPDDSATVAATIIEGTGCCNTVITCATNEGSDTIVNGFTITGGTGTFIEIACNPLCVDVFQGGGMRNIASSPTVKNCVFTGNSAQGTGGFGSGGGVANENASPSFINCAFIDNIATAGGGMENNGGSPTIVGCVFIDNLAFGGGGIANGSNSTPLVLNCTFIANNAVQTGGGLRSFNANATVINCTFNGNTAVNDGGGVYSVGTTGSTTTIANSILWANSPEAVFDAPGGVTTVTFSNIQGGFAGAGNINTDPLFSDADGPDNIAGTEDDDLRLTAGSLCIDAGDNTVVPPDALDLDDDADIAELTPIDIDGNPRFVDDTGTIDTGNGTAPIVDMGAYEIPDVPDCPADITDSVGGPPDGTVNVFDLLELLDNWGTNGPGANIATPHNDVVDVFDLLDLLAAWGDC